MTILYLVIWLAVIGFVVWLVTTYIKMPEQIKIMIIVVATILCVVWVLQLTGILGSPLGPPIPRFR